LDLKPYLIKITNIFLGVFMEAVYISRKGYEKLIAELESLKKEKVELSAEIGETMAQGDLKENAGYIAAKERQAEILKRIEAVEYKIHHAQFVENLDVDKTAACIGATVTIEDMGDGYKSTYTLVGSEESDPEQDMISVHSPLAQGIMGKKEGEIFEVSLPKGPVKFKMLKIEYK
jgi:transcription elongation factor GreA